MPIAALIGAGSLLGGLFGSKKANTTTQNSTSTSTYSADQNSLQGDLFSQLAKRLANPDDNITAQKNAATGNINANFDATNNRVTSKLAGLGFGESGKLGTNIQQNEIGRAGAQSANEGQFAQLKQQYDQQTLQDAMQFAFMNPGKTTSGTSTGPNPGALGGAISGGLSTATMLYSLNHFMQGGGVGDNGSFGDPGYGEDDGPIGNGGAPAGGSGGAWTGDDGGNG